MAELSFPFQSGPGAQVTEPLWSMMARVFAQTGVVKGALGELAVTASGSDMTVSVASGRAVIQGEFYQSDATQKKTIAPADSTNPRIDRVILRLDWTAKNITLVVLTGTPAANPEPPDLTQNDILSGASQPMWEVSLARVYVPAGATSISQSNITDERGFVGYPTSVAATPDTIPVRDSAGMIAGTPYVDSNGVGWIGNNQIVTNDQFGNSLASNGYQKLPSGLIMQWGRVNISSGTTITFPIKFPNGFLQAVVTPHAGSAQYASYAYETTSGMTIYHSYSSTLYVSYLAVGW